MIDNRIIILEDFKFNGKVYKKGHQFTITGDDNTRWIDFEGRGCEDDYLVIWMRQIDPVKSYRNNIEIRNNVIKWDFLSQVREEKIDVILKPGHYCPYCGHHEMLVNNHFTHIEWNHPDKSLY